MTLHPLEFETFQGPAKRVEDDLHAHLHGDSDGMGALRAMRFAVPVSLVLWALIIGAIAWIL